MAYNTVPIARNNLNEPLPQYYNPVTDAYEVIQGEGGASKVKVVNPETEPVPDKIVGSGIAVPTDKQAVYRTLAFSTTTPLAADASYTSASFDGLLFRRLTGRVVADQAGTLNLQHSDDGATWDTLTSISVAANTPVKFDEPIYCRYVRVIYVNGATAQTVFRLSAYLSAE